jgi:hypothetical protein
MDLNQVTLTGTIERDPITKAGDSGMVVHFTIRVVEVNPSGQAFKIETVVKTPGLSSPCLME